MRAALLLALLASPALADGPLDADAFEALVAGRTIAWSLGDAKPYGYEIYRDGRRVVWTMAAGQDCLAGEWYESRPDGPKGDPAICFRYEDGGAPDCWAVFADKGRLTVRSLDGGGTLHETGDAPGSVLCDGVGV